MSTLEQELEKQKAENSELEDNLKLSKKNELDLIQQLKKQELTVQKMRYHFDILTVSFECKNRYCFD